MDIQLEKIELMKLLLETENPSIINSIKKVFQKEKKDWLDDLSEEQKEAIEEGIRDADQGRTIPYKVFMESFLK